MNKRSTIGIAFFVCAAMLLLGAAIGAVSALLLPSETPMHEYLTSFSVSDATFASRFAAAIVTMGKFPLLATLLAFSLLGVAGVPILTAIRGLLLGFAVTSLTRYCGASGALPILGAFAAEALIAVPSLLLCSARMTDASLSLLRRGKPYDAAFVRSVLACAAATVLAAAIEAALSPMMHGVISAHFPT